MIINNGKYVIQDGNMRLLLNNAQLQDAGSYRIDIRRLESLIINRVTTNILLSIPGNCYVL